MFFQRKYKRLQTFVEFFFLIKQVEIKGIL